MTLDFATILLYVYHGLRFGIEMRISFDRVAEIFDKTRGPPKHIMKQLVKTLADELLDYRRILDVGVGTGRFAKPLQDYGFEVSGINIAKKMMSKAVEKQTAVA